MARLSVVVPATDRPPTLGRVVDAIRHARAAPEELIVVDDAPRAGPAAARNVGARRAQGDILVFVDADVEVRADAFIRIREAFDRDPSIDAVFGSYDDDPSSRSMVSDFRNLLHHHVHHENAGVAATFWAGLGAMRRAVFLEIGGFDEERFPRSSIEDVELGARLHARGGQIRLDPAIQGKHLKAWTLASMVETDLLRRGVPWLRLILETRSPTAVLNLGWRHRISTVLSVLLVAGLVRRNARLVGAALVLMLLVERPFYGLLLRARGSAFLVVAVPLHILHRLVSAAAVPVALVGHIRALRRLP